MTSLNDISNHWTGKWLEGAVEWTREWSMDA